MIERPNQNNDLHEEVLLKMRPAWRSFLVFFLGIALCVGGPLLKADSPLSPTIGFIIGAIFLLIIIRRWSNVYTLTNRRLLVKAGPFLKNKVEISLEDIDTVEIHQGLTLRLTATGHVLIHSRRPDQANILLYGLPGPMNFKDRLEKLVAEARASASQAR
ncbi:MAG: PH domain-containing protein [Deltaproteobacteria bacterium]|nr:PH domain-containing protein [Deltaproteobacteria bacterium]MBW2085043.1 PH domain-containing protein [Deltaproteobacteria bacterium]